MGGTLWAALCAAGVVAFAGQAEAATYFITESLDTALPGIPGSGGGIQIYRDANGIGPGALPFSPDVSQLLSVGDTLDMTVMFLPGQAITMLSPQGIQSALFMSVGGAYDYVTTTSTLQLLDALGGVVFSGGQHTETENFILASVGFHEDVVPSSLTFSGYRVVSTIDNFDYHQPILQGLTSATFFAPYVMFAAADGIFVPFDPRPVPEPATWAMLILGFFGLGAALRRQKSQIGAL
jgi:hypothetical protein